MNFQGNSPTIDVPVFDVDQHIGHHGRLFGQSSRLGCVLGVYTLAHVVFKARNFSEQKMTFHFNFNFNFSFEFFFIRLCCFLCMFLCSECSLVERTPRFDYIIELQRLMYEVLRKAAALKFPYPLK